MAETKTDKPTTFAEFACVMAVFLFVGILMLFGGFIGADISNDAWEIETVKRGAAKWEVRENGSTKFVWLTEPKAESGADQ